ncbi:MAG: 3-mercaptopyruvate sulfurtransferase [Alphaproteobacteria bacterium]|nr:3-mercaptopyruvate sulfurtransferase [Alphaproteobacteria bacterium]MBU1513694.1 3-mercaptopyruvate sulfurtransferase [Alphaproteobacteria bacterium]MBU2094661.1 3-mercaptopyruvate sulfurtransferase [Alphaproteobacteria bacterium]MBU2150270.1 3-mercaptopyruvate sulfurtransferase [Alphaproteobacteria bacterium]MBU2309201.1 3-mercaptopyruvate sulfurtransferase [Alphaproteobacteria bacterium]
MAGINPLVSAAWLAERLGDPAVLIVDATLPLVGQPGHGRDSYLAGHVPGAVFFDINAIADPDTDLPHMLPTTQAFAEAAGALGLSRDATIVVYDAHGIYSAPRVWWTLRVMGYPKVFVLDGGLKAWRAEGRMLETHVQTPLPVAVAPQPDPALVRDLDAVTGILADGSAQIVDARSAGRFTGQAPEPRATLRSGHMPGALNLPFDRVVNADGTLKSVDELKAVFAHVDLGRPIVTTCGSGVTASVLALSLARLGRFDVAVYDGSWTEWGGRPDTAIVTGA